MAYHYIWLSSNPNLAEHLRRANEARSANIYQSLGAPRRGLAVLKDAALDVFRWMQRRVRERAALRELSALDDRSLKDIGISRGEILRVAAASVQRTDEAPAPAAERTDDQAGDTHGRPVWLRGIVDGDRAAAQHTATDEPTRSDAAPDRQPPSAAHG